MNVLRKFSAPIALVVTMSMLSACADTDDGRTTQAQGTGAGALLGAAVGAALGYAVGGGSGAARGAAAGAVFGAAQGFAYGSHVAAKKAAYRNTEDYLDACISSARKYRQHVYAYNQTLRGQIASLEQRSRAAVASRDRAKLGQIRGEIATLKKKSQSEYRIADEEVSAQRGALSDGGVKSSPKSSQLSSEVDGLQQNKAQLGQNISRLASLDNEANL